MDTCHACGKEKVVGRITCWSCGAWWPPEVAALAALAERLDTPSEPPPDPASTDPSAAAGESLAPDQPQG